jgi:NADH dehydrogenase FAD-containing subunit
MIPGAIARQYTPDQLTIHLPSLCKYNQVLFIRADVARIDTKEKKIWTTGRNISFWLLTLRTY